MKGHVPTRRRLEYARGYLELGLLDESSDELEEIAFDERLCANVLEVRVELYLAAKQWDMVIDIARRLAEADPGIEQAWINWAFALRVLERITDARDVLRRAEPLHGKTSGMLHYNLACYECLAGNIAEARRRLSVACSMQKRWLKDAHRDPDLKALWREPGSEGIRITYE